MPKDVAIASIRFTDKPLQYNEKLAMVIDSLPNVNFYKPNDDINWVVRKFETINYNGSQQNFSDSFIPRPDIALVFNFKNIPIVLSPENIKLKSIFIATIPVRPLLLSIVGQIDSFIVVFKATVFSRIFKINVANTTPIVDVNDKKLLQLNDLLMQRRSDSERIECFSEFIRGLICNDYKPDEIDNIYTDILENATIKPLQLMLGNIFLSKSSLRRNFSKRTGVSMKKMVQIARIHSILESMLKEKQFDFRKMFSESMYYDQSHFINDFKKITGSSPMKFFRQNTEVLKMISGIENKQ